MIFTRLKAGSEVGDEEFDLMYNRRMKQFSKFHFTPVEVAKKAARFLVDNPGTRVLDVGSGAGKFCMVGAACTPGVFVGVEQRLALVDLSRLLAQNHQLSNTVFIHANILDVELRAYDAIYFFNAFHENIYRENPLDNSVRLDKALYGIYVEYLKDQLAQLPVGTKLATYFTCNTEIPDNYQLQEADFDRKLKLWKKTS